MDEVKKEEEKTPTAEAPQTGMVVKKLGSLIFQAYRVEMMQLLENDELLSLRTTRKIEMLGTMARKLHRGLAEDVGGVGVPDFDNPDPDGVYEGGGMMRGVGIRPVGGNDQMDFLREIMVMAQPAFQAIADKAKRPPAEPLVYTPPPEERLRMLLETRRQFVEIGRQTDKIDAEIDIVNNMLGQPEQEEGNEHDQVAAALDITGLQPPVVAPPGDLVHPFDVRGRAPGEDHDVVVPPPDRAPDDR